MCFSATASFATSAVLIVTGAVCLKKVHEPRYILLASVPIIFSVQQFSEGMLWLALKNPQYYWSATAAYTFLLFAQVVWPVWIPLTFYLPEKDAVRKKILMGLLCLGILVSAYLAYCLLNYDMVFSISDHHIQYDIRSTSYFGWTSGLFYILAAVIPPFISSIKKAWLIAALVLLSYLISRLYFHDTLISVWCFFAAIISVVILIIVSKNPRPFKVT
jgi:hypothetical protein